MDRAVGRPRHLLHPSVHTLESRTERAEPGGPGRHSALAVLRLLHRTVAAGGVLFHRPADPGLSASVPVQRAVRPRVVRLRLPADGVDRPLHLGRAPYRGRPARPHQTRRVALDGRQDHEARRQTRGLAADRPVHRRRRNALFRRRADADERILHPQGAVRRLPMGRHSHLHHVFAGRPHARAGLPLHVSVAAHPGGADRQRGAQRHLSLRSRRAAHVGQGRAEGSRARATCRRLHRLHAVRRGLPHRCGHPPGLAIGLHPVRAVHRRLRRGDDQDQAADAADRLRHRRKPRAAQARRTRTSIISFARARFCTQR